MDRSQELKDGLAHLDDLISQTQTAMEGASGEELRALDARLEGLQGKRQDAENELEGL